MQKIGRLGRLKEILGIREIVYRPIRSDFCSASLLIACFILMVLLVNPIGEFPTYDDWIYAATVKSILEKGRFEIQTGSSANVFAHAYWGAIFCLPFGFSFTALRFSILTLGIIGVLATYFLLKELSQSYTLSLLGALTLLVNPVYFWSCNTFMTDISFYCFAVLAVLFILLGNRTNSFVVTAFGLALSLISILIRQVGIAIPVSYAIAYLLQRGVRPRTLFNAVLPALAGISIHITFRLWVAHYQRMPQELNPQYKMAIDLIMHGPFGVCHNIAGVGLYALFYLGMFLFPFIILLDRNADRLDSNRAARYWLLGISWFCITLMALRMLVKGRCMPYFQGIIQTHGLGPMLLRDTGNLRVNLPVVPRAITVFWFCMSVISAIGAVYLTYYCICALSQFLRGCKGSARGAEYWNLSISLLVGVFYFAPTAVVYFHDRYYLLLIPTCMMLCTIGAGFSISHKIHKTSMFVSVFLILITAGFSTCATRDYMEWNRVRWTVLKQLEDEGIRANNIDGGSEFNGWHISERPSDVSNGGFGLGATVWCVEGEYVVASGKLAGYKELRRYPFKRMLTLQQEDIIVLRKIY